MILITCANCGQQILKPAGQINRSRKAGQKVYCSIKCCGECRRKDRGPDWYECRFIAGPAKIATRCTECGRSMWLPPSKAAMYPRCGPECTRAYRARLREARRRECETCNKVFYPRAVQIAQGGGRFCSNKCNTALKAANFDPVVQARRAARLADLRAEGLINYRRGPDSPVWKGGLAAALRRRTETGKAAASLRAYRRANPDKVREFTQSRQRRKFGRLPRGTIRRIGLLQGWRCAICRRSIKSRYHADHIFPLALDGRHIPANIQLLCGPCNMSKGARDPIQHMQTLGRLL